jgi:hypothetical protein
VTNSNIGDKAVRNGILHVNPPLFVTAPAPFRRASDCIKA